MHVRSVLVVEDDPVLCRLIRSVLEKAHCHVTVASTLSKARFHLSKQDFAMVLSDIHLNHDVALDFLKTCRLNQQFVVAVSSDDSFKAEIEALGIYFITKPISLKQLLDLAENLVPS